MKARNVSVLLIASLVLIVSAPALAQFPTWTPAWWENWEGWGGAAIYDFSRPPEDAVYMIWLGPDTWIPDPPPGWMTDNPERNYCDLSHDLRWVADAFVGGRTGGFALAGRSLADTRSPRACAP